MRARLQGNAEVDITFQKNLKKAGSRETELWHTARADA